MKAIYFSLIVTMFVLSSCSYEDEKAKDVEIVKDFIASPADMIGQTFSVEKEDGLEHYLIKDIEMSQDCNYWLFISAFEYVRLSDDSVFSFSSDEALCSGHEGEHSNQSILRFDDFLLRASDSTLLEVDSLRMRAIKIGESFDFEIFSISGDGFEYHAEDVPKYCYLYFDSGCDHFYDCDQQKMPNACRGSGDPWCRCETTNKQCWVRLKPDCKTVDCEKACKLMGYYDKDPWCFCDI